MGLPCRRLRPTACIGAGEEGERSGKDAECTVTLLGHKRWPRLHESPRPNFHSPTSTSTWLATMFFIGTFLYTAVLLINALAILSEDRFLARSAQLFISSRVRALTRDITVGWSSTQPASVNAAFQQPYVQPGFDAGQPDIGVKNRLINLISAVRTLMRSACHFCPLSKMYTDDRNF